MPVDPFGTLRNSFKEDWLRETKGMWQRLKQRLLALFHRKPIVRWVQVSGPNLANISNDGRIENLVQGTYIFRCIVITKSGLMTTADMKAEVSLTAYPELRQPGQ